MVETGDDWRQAFVAIIGFIHVGIQLMVFCVYVGSSRYYNEVARGIMVFLCVPQAVTSIILIRGALEKKPRLFVAWLLTSLIMMASMITYTVKVWGREPIFLPTSVVIFSICSYVPVYGIGSCFLQSLKSSSQHGAIESNPLNNRISRLPPTPVVLTDCYASTDEETAATTTPVVVQQSTTVSPNSIAHDTTERYLLRSRHNRPTAPSTDVPQSAAFSVNTTANMADDPPGYDEAVAKVPYRPYAVAAANPPYPLTDPVGMPNLPYPIADSVAATNPPYPMGDPIGAPTPQHSVAGPSDISIVGWRTDLFPDNAKT